MTASPPNALATAMLPKLMMMLELAPSGCIAMNAIGMSAGRVVDERRPRVQ